MNNKLA